MITDASGSPRWVVPATLAPHLRDMGAAGAPERTAAFVRATTQHEPVTYAATRTLPATHRGYTTLLGLRDAEGRTSSVLVAAYRLGALLPRVTNASPYAVRVTWGGEQALHAHQTSAPASLYGQAFTASTDISLPGGAQLTMLVTPTAALLGHQLSGLPRLVLVLETACSASRRARLREPARASVAATVEVPVIGSLNGVTPGGWANYARAMQDAGAAAIELNIYYLPGDPEISGRDVKYAYVRHTRRKVKAAVTIPVAVKLGPHFSSTGRDGASARRSRGRRARALQSLPAARHRPRARSPWCPSWWDSPRARRRPGCHARGSRSCAAGCAAALAATTGVEEPADVARYLLAGADVVMTTSALLRHGYGRVGVLLDGLSELDGRARGSQRVDDVRGILSVCARRATRRHTSARAT